MRIPDWRVLPLEPGVLREPDPGGNRLILWLPRQVEGGLQHWERVGNVPGAAVAVAQGVCATPATAMGARQRNQGFLGRLWQRTRGAETDGAWILPNGKSAEPWGDKRSDLLLVWAADENVQLDESRIHSLYPQSTGIEALGKRLFLVSGVKPVPAQGEAAGEDKPESEPEQAERFLEAARQSSDRRREASALIDLGMARQKEGQVPRALEVLEEALALARRFGDRSLVSEVLGRLGLIAEAGGERRRALEYFEQELAEARAAGDRFAEQTALSHLGFAYSNLHDASRALPYFEQALTLTREAGDRSHEADLLWFTGVQHAELGQRSQASARAEAAVDLLRNLGKPYADVYADHLGRYRQGEPGAGLGGAQEAGPGTGDPGLLRMAFSAARALGTFLKSGLKTVPAGQRQQRLQACSACEHFTGMRCRVCGCFTRAKASLPYEKCPLGKWPG